MAECINNNVMEKLGDEILVSLRLDKEGPQKLKCRHHCHCTEVYNGFKKILTKPYLRSLRRDAQNKRQDKRLQALKTVKQILSSDHLHNQIDDLVNAGFIPVFIECLSEFQNPPLQFEAAWALTNICGSTPDRKQAVVSANAIPILMEVLLISSDFRIWDQVIWALGNIIFDSPQLRDEVISLNLLPRLVYIVHQNVHKLFMRRIMWIIAIIGPRSKIEPPVSQEVLVELLPALNKIIEINDAAGIIEAVDTICQIIRKNHDLIQNVIDVGVLPNLVPLLLHKSNAVQLGALFALVHIASGTDDHTQAVIDTGVLIHFPFLLSVPEDKIRQQALCLLTFMTEFVGIKSIGNVGTTIIETGIVPIVIMNLKRGSIQSQLQAAYVITNLVKICNKDHLKYIIGEGVVEAICSLLVYDVNDISIEVLRCLDCLLKQSMPNINALTDTIEECGGLEMIEKLQDKENDTVYRLSFDLIKTYFSEESD